MYTLLAKSALCKSEHPEQGSSSSATNMDAYSEPSKAKGKDVIDGCVNKKLESEFGSLSLKDNLEGNNVVHNLLVELADNIVDFQAAVSNSKQKMQQASCSRSNSDSIYSCSMEQSSSLSNSFPEKNSNRTSCSYVEVPISVGIVGIGGSGVAKEGPSEEGAYNLNKNNWLAGEQSTQCSSLDPSCDGLVLNDWGRCGIPSLSWGGRVVGGRLVKGYAKAT